MKMSASPARTTEPIGNDRLLGIADIQDRTGFGAVTASKLMDESGYAIVLHRRKFILESNLLRYLHSKEAM